jgi:hypothetical protein
MSGSTSGDGAAAGGPEGPTPARPRPANRDARAYLAGYTPSSVSTATYTLDAAGAPATPVLSSSGGRFASQTSVVVSGQTGTTIRYTLSGVEPTTADPTVTSGTAIVIDRSLVLKVRAWNASGQPGAVRRADFVITGALATGSMHSVALKANGSVCAWGRNSQGQLGDGTSTDQATPVQVRMGDGLAFTGATTIAVGGTQTLAIKADGSLWSWGENVSRPTGVSGITSPKAIAAGERHALVVA